MGIGILRCLWGLTKTLLVIGLVALPFVVCHFLLGNPAWGFAVYVVLIFGLFLFIDATDKIEKEIKAKEEANAKSLLEVPQEPVPNPTISNSNGGSGNRWDHVIAPPNGFEWPTGVRSTDTNHRT